MRESYGQALLELGRSNPDVVVLDADVAPSTCTDAFSREFPQRFISVGIAEQNLVGIAAGLALSGKIPYVTSFAVFVPGKCLDQIRNMIAYPKLNVKIVSTHAGVATGEDGATHQSIEDLAVMRSIPNFMVICPADSTSTRYFTLEISRIDSPVYMRLARPPVPVIYDSDEDLSLREAQVLRDGSDIAIFSHGICVKQSMDAAEELSSQGIDAAVIDMHTLKPMDAKSVLKYAKIAGRIITVEDHSIIGGLGSGIAEILAENYPARLLRLGIPDRFGESGSYEQLLKMFGIDSKSIASKARKLIEEDRR